MTQTIKKAIIFAAGKGERLRPYTDDRPKPMVDVAGQSIIKRILAKLAEQGVEEVVVNLHYMGEKLVEHLQDVVAPKIVFSLETDLLDTGGGAKKILDFFEGQPFWAFNGDMLWHDGSEPLLRAMESAWNPARMDCMILLYPTDEVPGFEGTGDYHLADDGRLRRERNKPDPAPYVFAGARICNPALFDGIEKDRFSFLEIFDKAEAQGTLYGHVHDGEWFHISDPEMLRQSALRIQSLEAGKSLSPKREAVL